MINLIKNYFSRMKGGKPSPSRNPFSKIAWSWLGAFIGIYCVSELNHFLHIDLLNSVFLVGSFGASAVLIYGAPQAEFSQPRNLIGGHLISAFIGITIYKFVPLDSTILGALAVSLAIVAMHFTCTLHPPGGATALIAVIGSDNIHDLGYLFVLSPIGAGALIMLIVALFTNNLSSNPERHYPRYWF